METSIEWLIGTFLAFIVAIGGVIMRDRQVMKAITDGDDKLNRRIDEAQSTFVRRDDLNGHIQSIENTVNSMREEQQETNRRIDTLLFALTQKDA